MNTRLGELEATRDRLEQVILHHQAEQKRLETVNDRLRVEFAERGKVNASLNKRLAKTEAHHHALVEAARDIVRYLCPDQRTSVEAHMRLLEIALRKLDETPKPDEAPQLDGEIRRERLRVTLTYEQLRTVAEAAKALATARRAAETADTVAAEHATQRAFDRALDRLCASVTALDSPSMP